MRCLFISFPAMCRKLMLGEITFDDLATGLFCLGVPRERALDWQFIRQQIVRSQDHGAPEPAETFCRQIGVVILAADHNGLILWPDRSDGFRCASSLNMFLQANGYGFLRPGFAGSVADLTIAYAVEDACLPLQTIASD